MQGTLAGGMLTPYVSPAHPKTNGVAHASNGAQRAATQRDTILSNKATCVYDHRIGAITAPNTNSTNTKIAPITIAAVFVHQMPAAATRRAGKDSAAGSSRTAPGCLLPPPATAPQEPPIVEPTANSLDSRAPPRPWPPPS